MAIDEQTRARLLEAKILRIVAARGVEPVSATAVPGGAAALGPNDDCWVLVQDEPERAVGLTLAWALRNGSRRPTAVVDVDRGGRAQRAAAGVAARKGAALGAPVPVWLVDGSSVLDAEPAAPEPPGPHAPSPAATPWFDVAAALGIDTVVYADGALGFEVLGLEVGRVTPDGTLAVGAGRHDREATQEVWAGEPGREALLRAAESVRLERRADRIPTLASTLQRERWLRRALVVDPSPVGLEGLVPLPDAAPPADLRRPHPAAAVSLDGSTLVVCAVGGNLDLIPTAADLRAMHAPVAERIVLAVPPGDDHPITRDLTEALPVEAGVVVVQPPWG